MDVAEKFIGLIGAVIGGGLALIAAFLNKRFEEKRLKLQFEQSKLHAIYEDRKSAYKNVLIAMDEGIRAVGSHQPWDDAWHPIDEKSYEKIRIAIKKEELLVEAEAQAALDLFLNRMSEAVLWGWEREIPDYDKDREIREAYDEMQYLSTRIREFLRAEVQMCTKPALFQEICLLSACRFLCHSRFTDLEFTGQNMIKLDGRQRAMELLELAQSDMSSFKEEFGGFIELLENNPLKSRDQRRAMSLLLEAQGLLDSLTSEV